MAKKAAWKFDAVAAAILLVSCGLYYLVVASLTWVACIAFGFEFNWLLPIGVCAVIALLGLAVDKGGI